MSLNAVRVSVQPPIRMIPDLRQRGLPQTAPIQPPDLTMCGTDHVATLASRAIWDRTGEDLAMPRILRIV